MPSSLTVKGPRARRAPNRYSPSPTTTTHSSSRTPKSTPKKETSIKRKTTPKKKKTAKTTPKKITKQKKEKKKGSPAITTPSSPKKETKGRKPSTPQRIIAPTSTMVSNVNHPGGIIQRPFNNRLTQAQIHEIESLVSPWYCVEDIIRSLENVRKRSILD